MTKNLVIWKVIPNIWPTSREVGPKLMLGMMQMIKEDLTKGVHKDFGMSVNGEMGYVITELPEKELWANITRFQPYIDIEVHPLLSADDVINHLQKYIESLKK